MIIVSKNRDRHVNFRETDVLGRVEPLDCTV